MHLRIFTLRFSPSTERFDDSDVVGFLADKEVLSIRDHFFVTDDVPYLTLVVRYRIAAPPALAVSDKAKSQRDDSWREKLVEADWPLFNAGCCKVRWIWADRKTGAARVSRGGSWNSDADNCRSAYRNNWNDPADRNNNLGFRLASTSYPPDRRRLRMAHLCNRLVQSCRACAGVVRPNRSQPLASGSTSDGRRGLS